MTAEGQVRVDPGVPVLLIVTEPAGDAELKPKLFVLNPRAAIGSQLMTKLMVFPDDKVRVYDGATENACAMGIIPSRSSTPY
jgi:hypothetical protein